MTRGLKFRGPTLHLTHISITKSLLTTARRGFQFKAAPSQDRPLLVVRLIGKLPQLLHLTF